MSSFGKGLSCNHSSSMSTPIFIPSSDEPPLEEKANLIANLEALLIANEVEPDEKTEEKVTSEEKHKLKPFWNNSSLIASEDLWLPTEENSLVSNVSSFPVSQSWFSVTGNETFEDEEKYDLPLFTSTVPPLEQYKSLKIRFYPKKDQREKLKRTFDASKWAYNTYLAALKKLLNSSVYSEQGKLLHKKRKTETEKVKLDDIKVRELIRHVEIKKTQEEIKGEIKEFIDYIYNEDKKEFPFDDGWTDDDLQVRGSRGIVDNLVQNINSRLANGGDLKDLGYRKAKSDIEFACFESWCTNYIVSGRVQALKGHYKIGRTKINLEQLIPYLERKNFQLRHEKKADRYFLVVSVTHPCFQGIKGRFKYNLNVKDKIQGLKRIKNQEDLKICEIESKKKLTGKETLKELKELKRGEKLKLIKIKRKLKYKEQYQENYRITKNKPQTWDENQISNRREFIALDPGVRTFQTGYALEHTINIGENDVERLHSLLEKKEKEEKKIKQIRIQNKISNLVDELHWKVISYLTLNYKRVMIPKFSISHMVKGKEISKKTKKALYVFKFYQFRQRLINKGKERDCSIEVVTEEYTSKTCGRCGTIKWDLGGNKKFECGKCGLKIDRDLNGARNILIKNLFSKEDNPSRARVTLNKKQTSYRNVTFVD